MAEQKILISIQIKDDGSPELKKVEGALKGVSKETQKLNEHEKQREALQQKIIKSTSKEAVELKQLELRLQLANKRTCLLYTSPSPRDRQKSRMPSSA